VYNNLNIKQKQVYFNANMTFNKLAYHNYIITEHQLVSGPCNVSGSDALQTLQ
jgi:hypothetical protein